MNHVLEKHTRTILGTEYEVTVLNAIKGRKVFPRFAKLVVPVFVEMAKAKEAAKAATAKPAPKPEGEQKAEKVEDAIAALDPEVLAKFGVALERLVDKLTEEDVEYFCEAFAPATCVITYTDDGKKRAPSLKDTFAFHFAANYGAMLAWLLFCFEVNFGSFFGKTDLAAE